jgi:hypothetical protein
MGRLARRALRLPSIQSTRRDGKTRCRHGSLPSHTVRRDAIARVSHWVGVEPAALQVSSKWSSSNRGASLHGSAAAGFGMSSAESQWRSCPTRSIHPLASQPPSANTATKAGTLAPRSRTPIHINVSARHARRRRGTGRSGPAETKLRAPTKFRQFAVMLLALEQAQGAQRR